MQATITARLRTSSRPFRSALVISSTITTWLLVSPTFQECLS